jgi:acyl dehydratase
MQRTVHIEQEMIDRYGRINGDNDIIHYDHDYAVKRGFRGTLLHGPHMSALAADLGAERFGRDWLYRGRLHTKWIGPVCPGDAFVAELADDGTLDARAADGLVMVGSASLRAQA